MSSDLRETARQPGAHAAASIGRIGYAAARRRTIGLRDRLLFNMERAFNDVWGIEGGRTFLEQLRDYILIIMVTPLSLLAGAAARPPRTPRRSSRRAFRRVGVEPSRSAAKPEARLERRRRGATAA